MKKWIVAGLIVIISMTGALAENESVKEQLSKLKSLYEEGLITKDVYELKQRELLDSMLSGEDGAAVSQGVVDLQKGLVLYLGFNEASSNLPDGSGHENHGRVDGAKWIPVGRIGGAYQFEQKKRTQGILIKDSDSLDCETVTISAWIKTDDVGSGWTRIVDKGAGSENGFTLTMGGSLLDAKERADRWHGKAMFESSGRWVGTRQKVADGKWHHIVGVYGNGVARIYVDGKLDGERTFGNVEPIKGNDIDLMIGNRNPKHEKEPEPNAFDGQIDEVRIYNRVLNPDEVAALFAIAE